MKFFWNQNEIKLTKVSKLVYVKDVFATSWIYENSRFRAFGKVSLINYTDKEISLLPETRLESKNGILYTIPNRITIPSSKVNPSCTWSNCQKQVPWKIETNVIAKLYDNEDNIIGERWNIEAWVILYIPWLDEELQGKIYGKSLENFKWWSNDYEKTLWTQDLQNAKNIITTKTQSKGSKRKSEMR